MSMRRGYASYGCQTLSEQDIAAVVRVLRSDWLTQGPTIAQFEQGMCARVRARHAIAVSNGTAALHLACIALGLGPGRRLWTSPNTFVASANCARYCGAEVDFVDIDPRTLNMSVPLLEAKLIEAERAGRLPDVLVPVHFGGLPCDMAEIARLAKRYRFAVIEDASHAVGAEYRDEPVGSCRYADITVFSFHPVKIITTGEGGMLLTNDQALAAKLGLLRSHGITRDAAEMRAGTEGGWYYEQAMLGLNYRMTDIQAALGLSQLSRLDEFLARRRTLARRYQELLAGLPVTPQAGAPYALSAFHLYVVRLTHAADRRRLFDRLRSMEIGVHVHYIPVHLQPYYATLGFRRGDFPEAERYYEEALTLPLHCSLSDEDQEHAVACLRRALLESGSGV